MFNLTCLSRQSPRGEGRRNPHVASYGSRQERGTEGHTAIGGMAGGRGARPGELNPFPFSVVGAHQFACVLREGSHAVVDWRIMWWGIRCRKWEGGERG